MSSTTSTAIISALKSVFSQHSIPEIVRSDNGPQYPSTDFAESYGFQHITSSPYFPQSNGQAERMVQTAKHLLMPYPHKALLSYIQGHSFTLVKFKPSRAVDGETDPDISSANGRATHPSLAISA